MPALLPIFKKAYWTLAALGGFYAVVLLCLTRPYIQRHALYAHKLHTGYWDDLDRPEALGFGKNQVNSFYLETPDGERLYGWHVLPLALYVAREAELEEAARTNSSDSLAIKLLTEDPESRVVINFHGNAGHVAQGYRPLTYRSLTSASPKIHLFTVDYRGFGLSTGSPTETGLITDGVALVKHVMSLGIPADRIVLVGQSLGTAVASAVGLHFAEPITSSALMPKTEMVAKTAELAQQSESIDFAAIILVASFSSLPKLLLTYRIAGVMPVLSPLRSYPWVRDLLLSTLEDKWNTSLRLGALTAATAGTGRKLRLHILHARNDWEIPWFSSEENFEAANAVLNSQASDASGAQRHLNVRLKGDLESTRRKEIWLGEGEEEKVRLILEILRYGGHNQIVSDVPVALAVLKAFDLV